MIPASIARSGALLLSDDDTNTEYDRAIGELVTELLGLSLSDFAPVILQLMRDSRPMFFDCCDDHPYCDRCGEDRVRWRFPEIGVCDDCLPFDLRSMQEEP